MVESSRTSRATVSIATPQSARPCVTAATTALWDFASAKNPGGGFLKGNLHLKPPDGTPMANVMLALMHKLGLDDMTSFGDSTGKFEL